MSYGISISQNFTGVVNFFTHMINPLPGNMIWHNPIPISSPSMKVRELRICERKLVGRQFVL